MILYMEQWVFAVCLIAAWATGFFVRGILSWIHKTIRNNGETMIQEYNKIKIGDIIEQDGKKYRVARQVCEFSLSPTFELEPIDCENKKVDP
jgi:hypothetical protein